VVGNGTPFVSIGYIVPLPRDATSGLLTALRHELEGAYLAQWRANHHDGLGDIPLIRLLVVNVGDQAGQQDAVIPEVIQRVTDPAEYLVAVAGLGQSLYATEQAIRSLSEAGIPMIASRLTADDLNTTPAQPVRGLFRIPATNSAETLVAAHALETATTLLVQDINRGDAYTNSLAEQFRKVFATPPATGKLLEPERYDSSLPAVDNTFVQMMPSICTEQPAAIYYAGRGANLPGFLAALAGRRCQQLKLVTGDDGVDLTVALRRQLAAGDQSGIAAKLRTNITLRYTGLAPPGEWSDEQRFLPAATRIFQQDCATCFNRVFPEEQLDDGAAIVGYDAVLVAIRAIRSGASQGDTLADPAALTPGAVLQAMFRINRVDPVSGASGPIGFDE
jgi:ABC-type branched-subunit amino acid transport system substrate-binding protein